jgi:ectoine hydroxylase-related dioxygenase (phytanoyl-CoA dioxygenase family)
VHPVGLGIVGTNPHKDYSATLDILNSTLSVWVMFYKMTHMTHPTRVLKGILRKNFKIQNGLE